MNNSRICTVKKVSLQDLSDGFSFRIYRWFKSIVSSQREH